MERNLRMYSFQKVLLLFLGIILAGLITLMGIAYQNSKTYKNTAQWIKHTHTVILQALIVSSTAKDLQLANSNYIVTGDADMLTTYQQHREALIAQTNRLVMLTQDNQALLQRIRALQALIQNLVYFSDSCITQKHELGFSKEAIVTIARERKQFRFEINTRIGAISAEENRLLALREAANARSIRAASDSFPALLLLILFFLTATFILVFYHFKKRRMAELQLQANEAQFRMLLNSIKDLAIFMVDPNGIIRNWYRGAAHLSGYTDEEVIGKSLAIFYTPEDIKNDMPEKTLALAAQMGSYEAERWQVRKDGSRFWADVLTTAVYDEQGNVQGFTKVTRDYSLHKKAEDEMKRALQKERELHEMKSNFVSIASHEFRTPLSTILTSTGLLEQYRTTETQDKRDRHLQRIQLAVKALITILEEFLSLEKIEEGKVSPKRKVFNIKVVTEELRTALTSILKSGQQIAYQHTGDEQVLLDPAFIQHILTNLVSNASKYSAEGSLIKIKTRVVDGMIQLLVKDEGIGISKQDQLSLFERFFRASNASTMQGTGLGLHIVKRYVDLLGGNIEVNSELNKGSEFIITLYSAVPAQNA